MGDRHDLGLQEKATLSQGDRLKDAAADLDSVGKLLGKDVGGGFGLFGGWNPFADKTFGEHGADAAFPPFARAWNEEISTLAGALREIRNKIGDGVATTSGTDHGVGTQLNSIRVGPEGPR